MKSNSESITTFPDDSPLYHRNSKPESILKKSLSLATTRKFSFIKSLRQDSIMSKQNPDNDILSTRAPTTQIPSLNQSFVNSVDNNNKDKKLQIIPSLSYGDMTREILKKIESKRQFSVETMKLASNSLNPSFIQDIKNKNEITSTTPTLNKFSARDRDLTHDMEDTSRSDRVKKDINIKLDEILFEHDRRIKELDNQYNKKFLALDTRKILFKKLNIPTNYKALDTKLKDVIIKTDFMKNIHVQREKKSIDQKILEEEVNNKEYGYDEKKVRSQNIDKACALLDLKDKHVFDKWFEDNVINKYFDKIQGYDKDKGIMTSQYAGNTGIGYTCNGEQFNKAEYRNNTISNMNLFNRSNSINDKFEYNTHVYNSSRRNSQSPPTQYLKKRCNSQEKLGQNSPTTKKRYIFSRGGSMEKDKGIRNGTLTAAIGVANHKDTLEDQVNIKYKALYDKLSWTSELETKFLGYRKEHLSNNTIGKEYIMNQIALIDMYRKNSELNNIYKDIEYSDYNKNKNAYTLYDNKINRRIIQEEINTLKKDELNDLEIEIADNILAKFNNDKEFLYNERTKYYSKERIEKIKKNKLDDYTRARKESIKKGQLEQKIYSKRVKKLFTLKEKSDKLPISLTSTPAKASKSVSASSLSSSFLNRNIDNRFEGTNLHKEYLKNYPKYNKLKKALEKKEIIDYNNDNYHSFGQVFRNDKERSIKLTNNTVNNHELRLSLAQKLNRKYTGGPRNSQGKKVFGEGFYLLAIQRIQAFFRGILARKRCKKLKSEREDSWVRAIHFKNNSNEHEGKSIMSNGDVKSPKANI